MRKMQHGICGSLDPNVPDADNPHHLLQPMEVQELILDMARSGPKTRRELYAGYEGSADDLDNLLRNDLLREEGGRVWINFTVFSSEDHGLLWRAAQEHGKLLADAVAERVDDIHGILSEYRRSDVPVEKLAFIAVGCYILDNEGLRLLNELGYVRSSREQRGGEFTVWAVEKKPDLDLKGIYWGGHSDVYDDLVFTSFGDHADLPRRALPDALRQLYRIPDFIDADDTRTLMGEFRENLGWDLARLLRGVSGATVPQDTRCGVSVEALMKWLRFLGYIERDALTVPYFTEEERPMLQELRQTVSPQVEAWCEQHYDDMKEMMDDSTPLRHGVPYPEVFTQVWHYLFGWANKHLADMGVIFDTYQPGHQTPGCIGALAELGALR